MATAREPAPDPDPDRFDFDAAFDDDYLHFYAPYLSDAQSAADCDLLIRLTGMRPGERVLDLACGHGRIARELARFGLRVTGLDRCHGFLVLARRIAAEQGASVEWVHGDMRALPWSNEFDHVVCWFTSFGYFDDATNAGVVTQVHRALRPGGSFLVETMNLHQVVFDPSQHAVKRVGDDFMIDEKEYDPSTGRVSFERRIIRGGLARAFRFFVRLYSFTELRDLLERAGFGNVIGYGGDGEPFTVDSERLVVVARKDG